MIKNNPRLDQSSNSIKLVSSQLNQQDQCLCTDDKYQTFNETSIFNDAKLKDDNIRDILIKLIYLVNQGTKFSEQEIDQLFFRITKLFQSNNPKNRNMTYRLLKMIAPQQYMPILLQSLTKDLMSENQLIKMAALKFIPFIQSEEYIQQIERFIHNALIDQNLLLSSTALRVGIHIINRYPNLIEKWLFDVVQKLDETKENIQYHALILFHEIKKSNLAQFIKIIIILSKKQLEPLIKIQIIKFIQEIMPLAENPYKKVLYFNKTQELLTYLFHYVQINDPLTFFVSSKVLVGQPELEKQQLITINQILLNCITNYHANSIQLFSCLKYIDHLSRLNQSLLNNPIVIKVYNLTYDIRITISQLALNITLIINQRNTALNLKQFYDKLHESYKIPFLSGLLELINFTTNYNLVIFEFLRLINLQYYQTELIYMAIQILEIILKDAQLNLEDAKELIIKLTENGCTELKYQAIRIINRIFLNINTTLVDLQKIGLWYRYLKPYNIAKMNDKQLNFIKDQYNILLTNQLTFKKVETGDRQEDKVI